MGGPAVAQAQKPMRSPPSFVFKPYLAAKGGYGTAPVVQVRSSRPPAPTSARASSCRHGWSAPWRRRRTARRAAGLATSAVGGGFNLLLLIHPQTHDNGNAASEPCSSVVGCKGQPPVVFARSASAPPCLCALDQPAIGLHVLRASRSLRPELTSESDHGVRVTKPASLSDCHCQSTAQPHCGCGDAGACLVKGRPKTGRSPIGPDLISARPR